MKKLTLILGLLLVVIMLFGQYKIDTLFYSEALEENKMVDVYFPPGYDENPDWQFPVIYYLHGYGGNQNTMNTMMNMVTQMVNDNIIEPVIMVGADNSPGPIGGSGYVNSILWGNYEDYMVYDLVEWIDNSFRTIPDKKARGLLGQSMGGYGAFRYGILHNDIFSILASHAGPLNFNDEFFRIESQEAIKNENPGQPYFYTCGGNRPNTILSFLGCGMYAPDTNTTQTYISPPVVQFLMDENGDYIDTVLAKQEPYDIIFMIDSLASADSVGIFFGCGANDDFYLYQGTMALKDTLDIMGLNYEFFNHNGGHSPPIQFKENALVFLDSLLINPGPLDNINPLRKSNIKSLIIYPNPFTNQITIQFEQQEKALIEIGIWNHLGQKISVICNGIKQAGPHQYTIDASGLPAGVYFCKLKLGNDAVMKKIIKL